MRGRTRSLLHLVGVQACWSYDRMQGVGIAHAVEPLLRPLIALDPARGCAALARSAEFFNANPYVASIAVGATARAELDGAPPEVIRRLRAALTGSLGALGDQLFWAGTVPALMSLALIGVAFQVGILAIVVVVGAHNVFRGWVTRWGLALGWEAGPAVGPAVARSWLPRAAVAVGPAAALLSGAAVPLAAGWLLAEGRTGEGPVAVAVLGGAMGLGLALGPRLGARVSAVRLTLVVAGLTLLWHWWGLA